MSKSRFPRRNKIARNCDLNKNIKYQQIIKFKPTCYWYSLGDDWYKFRFEITESETVKNQVVCEIKIKRNMFTTLEKKEKGKILVISSLKDVNALNKKYLTTHKKHKLKLIDFNQLAKTYSGIEFRNYHKIKKEIHKQNDSDSLAKNYLWYMTIDVNSGCVWDLDLIDVRKVGKLKDMI